MTPEVKLEHVYAISEDIVVRELEGELIIIPIASGIGDMEEELFSMNETGKAILNLLNGKRSLAQVARDLEEKFDALPDEIEKDVLGVVSELVRRGMLTKIQ